MAKLSSNILIMLIRVYWLLLKPFLGYRCRYAPTCSHYTEQAIKTHGAVKGGYLGLKRICRCHPWGGHGHDPVPK